MKIFVKYQHYAFFSVVLLFIALPMCFAVTMDVHVGFDGVAKYSVWTPITVQLSNPGNEDIQADLNISQYDNDDLVVCTSAVNLPARSKKKVYHVYARLNDYYDNVVVSLVRGRSIYATKKVKLNMVSDNDAVVVTVGDKAVRLNSIMGENIKLPQVTNSYYNSGAVDSTISAGTLVTSKLPDRPSGYDGVDMMVLGGLAPSSTDTKALDAIAMWVASGGTLVIPTGPNYKNFQYDFYNELLPVNITGAVNVSNLSCLTTTSKQAFPSGPVTLAMSSVKPGMGKVILAEEDIPIVVERRYGAGKVVFLAFDNASSPFKNWDGQVGFWKEMLKGAICRPAVESSASIIREMRSDNYGRMGILDLNMLEDGKSLVGVILQSNLVKMPSFNTIGLFLLAYLIILVPVNYIVLKRRRRLELAWITTPVIVIVFSLGAYAIGYTMKGGQLKLMEATVIETGSGNRYARSITNASIFSPARRSYRVEYAGDSSVGEVLAIKEERVPPVFIGERSSIEGVSMPMWSSKLLECEGGVDLGGCIASDLRLKNYRLTGKLHNGTNLDLADAKIVYGDSVMDIGGFSKNDEADVKMKYIPVNAKMYVDHSNANAADGLAKFAVNRVRSMGVPVLVARVVKPGSVFSISNHKAEIDSAAYIFCRLSVGKNTGPAEIGPAVAGRLLLGCSGASTNPRTSDGYFAATFHRKGEVTAKFNISVPSNESNLKVVGSVKPSQGESIELLLFNFSKSQWKNVSIGEELSVLSDCVGPGNEMRVKIRSSGPTQADAVKVGIAVKNS